MNRDVVAHNSVHSGTRPLMRIERPGAERQQMGH